MNTDDLERTGVFISYSHNDQKWLDQLRVHLKPLDRDQNIDIWDDTRLRTGSKWQEEIRVAIQRAKVAVLLISPDFMASDFIDQNELPAILEAASAGGVVVLPLILRPSRFDRDERLNQFQTVNRPSEPLINMRQGKRDVIFEKLAQTIEDLFNHPASNLFNKTKDRALTKETQENKEKTRSAIHQVTEEQKLLATRPEESIRRPRIYISAPADHVLNHQQLEIKRGILHAVSQAGLQPQEFGVSGLPTNMTWNFDAANEVMNNCVGALVLALTRFRVWTESEQVAMATEYNHFEGGLAISRGLPTLILAEEEIQGRGVLYRGGGLLIVTIPESANSAWLKSSIFVSNFDSWCKSVKSRNRVFLGYSSALRVAASEIGQYLDSLGVSVFDWALEFRVAHSLKDEIERALGLCTSAIFLFGPDDDSTPRDNLIFELGYFVRTIGWERIMVICEGGTKLPTDFATVAGIRLKNRSDITAIQTHLRAFVYAKL